ncbi:MAG TPA: D-cysteine desulfhydrase family protein [Gemmataceae bacterium]|jgi:1-aminocyclopropane-1-carboxylate deaminase/D-cysteine desulfhydrase-like pyridoxal-dependent ACC family enzyme
MNFPVLSSEEVRRAFAALPRLNLAHLPTPLDEAPRFAERIGVGRVLIKRDDCTGMLFGGNKTRHNEFLLADALRHRCDVVVWGAGIQSNNCRQTAAACAKLGLECRLFLSRTTHDDDLQGNLLLDHLVGAHVELVDAPMGEPMLRLLKDRAEQLRAAGRRPYVWEEERGGPLAAVSYLLCMVEILEQVRQRGLAPTAVYAAAAGSTGAGLALGRVVLGLPWQVRLIAPIRWPWDTPQKMADVAGRAAALLELPHRLTRDDVELREDFIGPAYGAVTKESWEALRLLATTEGILLDPVYTAKAMAGLIHDAHEGRLGRDDTVVFLHTGGLPAVFAYRDDLLPHLWPSGKESSSAS